MLSIVKTTLAIAVLGSVSLASAPAFAAHRHHSGYVQPSYHSGYVQPTFQNRNVALPSTMVPPPEEQWFDRATQSFGGGA